MARDYGRPRVVDACEGRVGVVCPSGRAQGVLSSRGVGRLRRHVRRRPPPVISGSFPAARGGARSSALEPLPRTPELPERLGGLPARPCGRKGPEASRGRRPRPRDKTPVVDDAKAVEVGFLVLRGPPLRGERAASEDRVGGGGTRPPPPRRPLIDPLGSPRLILSPEGGSEGKGFLSLPQRRPPPQDPEPPPETPRDASPRPNTGTPTPTGRAAALGRVEPMAGLIPHRRSPGPDPSLAPSPRAPRGALSLASPPPARAPEPEDAPAATHTPPAPSQGLLTPRRLPPRPVRAPSPSAGQSPRTWGAPRVPRGLGPEFLSGPAPPSEWTPPARPGPARRGPRPPPATRGRVRLG